MPVTFDIYPEFIETKMHRVDTIDRAYEEKLMEEKWSRNKTLQRYKKKINSFSEEYNIKDCNKKIRAFKKENLINALIYTILIYTIESEIKLFSCVK